MSLRHLNIKGSVIGFDPNKVTISPTMTTEYNTHPKLTKLYVSDEAGVSNLKFKY